MRKFYVTTPIFYINDIPSLGSAYPTIIADILARWHRLNGEDVFFLTGLDENSQKTVKAAKEQGYKDVQKYTDQMAEKWLKTWQTLLVTNNGFIRTTEKRHIALVNNFFRGVYKNNDVYKGAYTGLYCDGCDAFVAESDMVQGRCPYHGIAPKKIAEENYFFRLSRYQNRLLGFLKKNPGFIKPKERYNEILNFVAMGLKDISITRPGLEWGIQFPIDRTQRFWVWFDALLNYISGAQDYWPASLHIVGKDIARFHCIQFIAMLMSAKYKLPKQVFAHGFITVNGQKMSKSLGNSVNPLYLSKKYSVDSLRYFLVREIPFGQDGDFSEEAMAKRHDTELANDLGNLLARTTSMVIKYLRGTASKKGNDELCKRLNFKKINRFMKNIELHNALSEIWLFINRCNKYANDTKPWVLAGKDRSRLQEVLYNLLEGLRTTAIMIQPFMPAASFEIARQLGIKNFKKHDFTYIRFGSQRRYNVVRGEVLFKKTK